MQSVKRTGLGLARRASFAFDPRRQGVTAIHNMLLVYLFIKKNFACECWNFLATFAFQC